MASIALEDIWDAPAEPSYPHASVKTSRTEEDDDTTTLPPSKRPKSTLFLDSDDSDDVSRPATRKVIPPATNRSEIDAMFDALEEEPDEAFQDLPPSLNLDALRKEADAKNAKAHAKANPLDLTGESSQNASGAARGNSKDDKDTTEKKRKPLPKLDEARLLGPDGFPALVKQTKNFKPKGKGHEFWTHRMYPKTQFRDTVQRVEKLCHSKRMHVALSVWRDESKGLINGRKVDAALSDSDNSSDDDNGGMPRNSNAASIAQDIVTAPTASSSRAPSRPPSSSEPPSSDGFDDFDIDAIIREEEEQQRVASEMSRQVSSPDTNPQYRSKPTVAPSPNVDDEAMWEQLIDELPDAALPPVSPPSIAPASSGNFNNDMDEDEDMWDAVREIEAARDSISTSSIHMQDASLVQNLDPPTNEEGWDEMYA
ncbi:predicted protein [Postia placenta Mad-698-R]|uniref:Chromosome segregation in meiosis protein n=1 Tax=Postia placenta MAD-698-R-SB12 TaxID=670580 RepID=A0A1X6N9H6_9APHY|nr:hypothetical protein POSPLADRAFT_1133929 [Postia placenta MAD-698-R-SB12]EED80138.1 predicted protein [Postia placenta Mad-698-R]OSX65298.1 hypothetical protein POSPLADRAFT_1133929 [Postia placenta MAD-698-R-SB12]